MARPPRTRASISLLVRASRIFRPGLPWPGLPSPSLAWSSLPGPGLSRWAALLLVGCFLALGCNRSGEPTESGPSEPAVTQVDVQGPAPVSAGETAHIPVGAFQAGSRPGDPGRRPEIEPREETIQLGPFRIDRLPYPNDPAEPPRLGVSRDAAARLCAERDGRLCTELEWERACKGPESSSYPTGDAWSDACEKDPRTCPNAFATLSMGALLEWTSSDVIPPRGETSPAGPVVRGAPATAPDPERRCARRATSSEVDQQAIGFRCCYGPPNGVKSREPSLGAPYKKLSLEVKQLRAILEQDPQTKDLAKDLTLFREPDAADTVVSRGPGDRKGFLFTVGALEWNPVRGARYLVFPGRSGKDTSFVLAYHIVNDAEYRLAASFVMKNEPGPIALAYSDSIRPRLHFSSCWGCPGETGKILHRPPEQVVILQP